MSYESLFGKYSSSLEPVYTTAQTAAAPAPSATYEPPAADYLLFGVILAGWFCMALLRKNVQKQSEKRSELENTVSELAPQSSPTILRKAA